VKPNLLPKDPDTLLAIAEEVADLLAGNGTEAGFPENAEAILRASIARTEYARSAYLAMLASANESGVADRFLAPARNASHRAEQQLRRRLTSLISEFSVLA
jgi:hypothetical protein